MDLISGVFSAFAGGFGGGGILKLAQAGLSAFIDSKKAARNLAMAKLEIEAEAEREKREMQRQQIELQHAAAIASQRAEEERRLAEMENQQQDAEDARKHDTRQLENWADKLPTLSQPAKGGFAAAVVGLIGGLVGAVSRLAFGFASFANTMVRPSVAFYVIGGYGALKWIIVTRVLEMELVGMEFFTTALPLMITPFDFSLIGSVFGFYFTDRAIARQEGRLAKGG